ncbi:MAG: c-type cytochrome, partial [Opitutales bacterium]
MICAVVLCGFTLLPEAHAESGLIATYSDGKNSVRRVVPTPNFTLAADESVHSQVAPEFEAIYEGILKVDRGGEYRFSGDARIEVAGQDAKGKALKLTTGEHAIKISYGRKAGPARLQVRWQADFFIEEPIPAHAYAHAKKQVDDQVMRWASIEHGRLLYENLNCGACHGAKEWNLSTRQGPDLSGVGSRVTGDWLQAWLKDPKHYRKSTAMPALLTNHDEVRDVTAFLLSLAKAPANEAETPNAGRLEAGKELFIEVGCSKCHGEANHSLSEVPGKYRSSQALARYLLDPLQVDPSGRMPQLFDPKTQVHEAALVAEYLFHGKSKDWPKFSDGDAFRGRKLVQARGCATCHSVKYDDQLLPNRLVAPQFTGKGARFNPQKGCLAAVPPKGAPNYGLAASDRAGLRGFLGSVAKAPVVA